ncbi:MAG TPA: hypothetical protein VEB68_05865 [Croceibacterium sp.]|nr:hypothetical protein [Croceibacterium sp.]
MRFHLLVGTLGLLMAAGPALAVDDIAVAEDAAFDHQRTQISFPPNLEGMDRKRVRDFGTEQHDVAAMYETDDQATFLTLYVYRAGLPDASLSFDRLIRVMAAREGFLPAGTGSLVPTTFRPTGSATSTGLAIAYDLAPGQPNSATGALLFPHGSWLIKLRATSSALDASQLGQLLRRVEASLKLPEPGFLSQPAYAVEACSTQLAAGTATRLEPEQAAVAAIAVMMDGVSSSQNEQGEKVPLPDVRWCRDERVEGLNVYRPDEATDRYAIAFGDSGNALFVGISMQELPGVGRHDQGVPIIYADADRIMLMAMTDRPPDPATAWEIAQDAQALAINDRDGNVQINTPGPAE